MAEPEDKRAMSGIAADAPMAPAYTLWQLVRYMLGLGTWGFGGPVALAGYMYRDLVERRRWISEGDYKEGLALAQLMPGPLAAQLAIYLGYVGFRLRGATLAGLAFVLPSFFMVVAGGVVWRWKDGSHYYVVRANALENNVSLYYVVQGSRKTLKYVDAPVAPGVWHTFKVEFASTRITVSLDGKRAIELDDSHIAGPGAAGMWTKADNARMNSDRC